MKTVNLELRDYLKPGGVYPYERLFEHMQQAMDAGNTVYVWGCAGHFVASGHPDITELPWHDGSGYYYKTAKNCVQRRGGRNMDI
jgi:hypothetical protein